MELYCPNCNRELINGDPIPDEVADSRVMRFIECECGARTQIATRRSWPRWYRLAWTTKEPKEAEWHTDKLEADREEHYGLIDKEAP